MECCSGEVQVLKPFNPKDAHVLIVEDSPQDQEIATRALKTFGIRNWRTARTAEDGLNEIRKHHYAVALVDHNLPGMNGLQFIERLRQVSPDTRAIVVTGVRQESIAVQAMKLGASDYVTKDDFLTSGIIRTLQAALRDETGSEDARQRAAVTAPTGELDGAITEGTWLLRALDDFHGHRWPGKAANDPLAPEWADALSMFVEYLNSSSEGFPDIDRESEDAFMRVVEHQGFSPRDILRIYVAALREIAGDSSKRTGSVTRPMVLLAHILARMVELSQMTSIAGFQSGAADLN